MNGACKHCGELVTSGKHGLSPEVAAEYPQAFCPRCSGVGAVMCATATRYHYRCACSVWWSEPVTPP